MKHKIISLVTAICLTLTCMVGMGITASAGSRGITIALSQEVCKAGETVEVKVTSNTNELSYACMVFEPEFNHDIFEIQDVTCSISDGTFLYNQDKENPKFIWYNTENHNLQVNEELFVITLKHIGETYVGGAYDITLNYDENNFCDENGTLVEVEVGQGSVTPFRKIRGDVDGDMSVTGTDVVMLSRYLVGLETEIQEDCADVNNDMSVDGRDLVKLARYIISMDFIYDMYF